MERGTFANIRIRNEMMGGKEGGNTIYYSRRPARRARRCRSSTRRMRYKKDGLETVVIGGKEYGTGSSRDWAAKGPKLLGVRAVITESFERIHRSNLIGMGVAPFCLRRDGKTPQGLRLHRPRGDRHSGPVGRDQAAHADEGDRPLSPTARRRRLPLVLMILTADEVAYFKNGGILPYVLRNLLAA